MRRETQLSALSRMGRWTGIPIRASVDTIPNATSATAPMAKAPLTRLLLRILVKRITYAEFYGIVVGGKQDLGGGETKVMPALGDNKNVMCYVDDIYVYLRARSDDSIERGRPGKHEEKPQSASDAERACLGDNN